MLLRILVLPVLINVSEKASAADTQKPFANHLLATAAIQNDIPDLIKNRTLDTGRVLRTPQDTQEFVKYYIIRSLTACHNVEEKVELPEGSIEGFKDDNGEMLYYLYSTRSRAMPSSEQQVKTACNHRYGDIRLKTLEVECSEDARKYSPGKCHLSMASKKLIINMLKNVFLADEPTAQTTTTSPEGSR